MIARQFSRMICSFAAASIGLSLAVAAVAQDSPRPNVVFILADDVGREVMGCYGGESYATPNLDKLAAGGTRFDHCYSMPVCHPTRVCLLTGRYPRRLANPAWGSFPAEAEAQTFAHVLRDAGYKTAIAGKWQLCLMQEEPDHPRRLGFDEWSLFGWHEGPRYYDPMIFENGSVRTDTAGRYGPDLYVDFLVDFIERNQAGPFFAFYSMALCHDVTDDLDRPVPYGPNGRYDNYHEMAEKMDEEIGRLVAAIERMDLRERTLILFTTDNGTAARSIIRFEDGRYVRDAVTSRFRGREVAGGKGQLTDWGTRVPMIANWPGVIEPNQVRSDLVDFSDLLPTLAELSGGQLPRGVEFDGHSFARLLTDGEPSARPWAYSESGAARFFVRTQRWKRYNDGRIFDMEADGDESQPLSVGDLPADARPVVDMLAEAAEGLAVSEADQP